VRALYRRIKTFGSSSEIVMVTTGLPPRLDRTHHLANGRLIARSLEGQTILKVLRTISSRSFWTRKPARTSIISLSQSSWGPLRRSRPMQYLSPTRWCEKVLTIEIARTRLARRYRRGDRRVYSGGSGSASSAAMMFGSNAVSGPDSEDGWFLVTACRARSYVTTMPQVSVSSSPRKAGGTIGRV
jgi:hypothetical protein